MSHQYEFDYYDEETDKTYQVEVELQNYHDPNYGADIDGNRGVAKDFVEVETFTVWFHGVEVTDKEIIKRAEKEFERSHDEKACNDCAEAYHEPKDYDYDEAQYEEFN